MASRSLRALPLHLGLLAVVPVMAWSQGSYSTNFPATENPISESQRWQVPSSVGAGKLWGDMQTAANFAYGVSQPTTYGDPTAILTGTWGPNQDVSGTVKVATDPNGADAEVELRLRMTMSANSISGYEAYCSLSSSNPYCHVARWNGPNGSYCNIESSAPKIYLVNGDVIRATASGANPVIITVYRNGSQIMTATDTGQNCSPGGAAGPFASGNPGIGVFNPSRPMNYFGFSSFSATDGTTQTQQNFTLSATPATQTIRPGTSAVYTVKVAPSGGFSGAVALSATGLPSGAAATFSPASVTGSGSSTLTVTTSTNTVSAGSTLKITGTSGSLTQTASAILAVTGSVGGASSGGAVSTACDINRDGSTNVLDVQVATNNYLSCSATTFQTYVSQVIGGVLGSCSVSSALHTVALNWVASTTSGVTYNVYRATTSGGYNYSTPLNAAPISGTSFTDCTVAVGQAYYYVIRAVDGSGNQSASSTETSISVPSS